MARAYPCFRIDSYEVAMPYYLEFLGFKVDFEWRHEPGFPVYMGISRGESPGISQGELALHLTEHKEVPREIGVMMDVEDVYALFEDLKSRDPDLAAELVDQPWEKTELHLKDPFGNKIIFTSLTKK